MSQKRKQHKNGGKERERENVKKSERVSERKEDMVIKVP